MRDWPLYLFIAAVFCLPLTLCGDPSIMEAVAVSIAPERQGVDCRCRLETWRERRP